MLQLVHLKVTNTKRQTFCLMVSIEGQSVAFISQVQEYLDPVRDYLQEEDKARFTGCEDFKDETKSLRKPWSTCLLF